MFKLNKKITVFIMLLLLVTSYFIFGQKQSEMIVLSTEEVNDELTGTILDFEEPSLEMSGAESDEPAMEEVKSIVVEVKGFVVSPGVYELPDNSRVIDLINKAGGILDNGDVNHLNLSKSLSDEMVVVVYEQDNLPELIEPISSDVEFDDIENTIYEKVVFEEKNDSSSSVEEKNESHDSSKISLNNGTVSELQTLPGIGEKKAQAIVDYRTNSGPFTSVNEIVNVNGIGESTYEKIKVYLIL